MLEKVEVKSWKREGDDDAPTMPYVPLMTDPIQAVSDLLSPNASRSSMKMIPNEKIIPSKQTLQKKAATSTTHAHPSSVSNPTLALLDPPRSTEVVDMVCVELKRLPTRNRRNFKTKT